MEIDGWGDRRKSDTHTDAKLFSCYKPWLTPYLLRTMDSRWPPQGSCTELEALAKAIAIFGASEKRGNGFSCFRTNSSAQAFYKAACKLYTSV